MNSPKFRVGQAVVCVNDKFPHAPRWLKNRPKLGVVYHIRHIRRALGDGSQWAVLLEEIHNTPPGGGIEDGFLAIRFAPVDLLAEADLAELLAETLPTS